MSRSRQVTRLSVVRFRGDTEPESFMLAGACGTVPLDISGRSFRLAVDPNQKPEDATGNIYLLTADITDAEGGLYSFPLTQQQADAPAGKYFFDIEMTYDPGTGSVTRTVAVGTWEIVEDITK